MRKSRVFREMLEYLAYNKKLMLVPILVLLVLAGGVALLAQSQSLAPFIYSMF